MNNFAWLVFASRRRLAMGLVACCMLATVTGCSTMGKVGNAVTFWSGSDEPSEDYLVDESASHDDIVAALTVTRAKMQEAPDEPYWPFHMGELYAATDSVAEAITFLQLTLQTDPAYAPAATLLSKLYYDAESYDGAIVLLEDFLTHNPDASDAVRAALALHLEALGDLDGAQTVLSECSTNSKEVRSARTFVSLRDDDLQIALDSAKRALEENSRSAANHNNYGIALLWAGRPLDARNAFENALKLHDELPGALYNMAILETFYFFNEEKGREWYDRYRKHSSEDPDGLSSLFATDLTRRLKSETED